jgi:hypothetical protein
LTAHPEKQGYCAIGWRTWVSVIDRHMVWSTAILLNKYFHSNNNCVVYLAPAMGNGFTITVLLCNFGFADTMKKLFSIAIRNRTHHP